MLEFKICISDLDYDSLIPILIPMVIKNKIAAKGAQFAASAKIKNMSQDERDAFAASFLTEHKDKILSGVASLLEKKGISGSVRSIEVNKK